ncbi:MAG: hopanoid biosynthesis-associated protein HpnK, partial [Caulobacteraceae bacterium]
MTRDRSGERRLIITADDFGAAPEVNEAVAIGHSQGVLTAASLMVGAPAAAEAVAIAKSLPSLRVGLHLVLVQGRPVMPPDEIPALVDAEGRFRSDMARAGAAIFFRPDARAQLAAEIAAQFAAFAATGLPLDHANAHKHFHLHPTIGALMARIGRRFGLKAARAPVEPRGVLRRVEP